MAKNELEKLKVYISMYKTLCGIIKEEDIKKITDFYEIKLSDKEVKKAFLEEFEYIDGYYTVDKQFAHEDYLTIRQNLPIRLLSTYEIAEYSLNMVEIMNAFNNQSIDEELAEKALSIEMQFNCFTADLDDKTNSKIKNELNISQDIFDKILNIFEEYGYKLRYWTFYGRTLDECETEILFNEIALKRKPKDNDLKTLLSILEDNQKQLIYDYYQYEKTDDSELIEMIVDQFEVESCFLMKEAYDALINEQFSYSITEEEYSSGFVFAYLDNGVKKIYVPKEIQEKLKLINPDDLDNEADDLLDSFEDELTTTDYVMNYISINGIIAKDKLKEMIYENHNIELSLDEIDEITKNFDVYTIDDKYYSLISDKFDALKLLSLKAKQDDYKVLDMNIHYFEKDVLDAIDDFVNDNWHDEDLKEEIAAFIWESAKFGTLNKDAIKFFAEDINLCKKDINIIEDFVKEFKNDVAIWTLNGYSYNDKKQTNKKKVGRNEPCPCGSGKKYKQCHGK